MIGPLTARLVAECEATCGQLRSPELRRRMLVLVERLREPRIRVAVGGRMNAGKSTLVNALVHQRLASTGATETTRVVTWFDYACRDAVRVCRPDGTTTVLPAATGGGVSDDVLLPDPASIAHLVVETPNEALRTRHTIVDTPGLDALSHLDPGSLAAMGNADAVVYVMPRPHERDLEAVRAIRESAGELRLGAANIVGVLSRIDTLSGEVDPWPEATSFAQRYADELRSTFSDVIPVVGLLAAAADGGEITEADARSLRTLSTADGIDLEEALSGVDQFRDWSAAPVGRPVRERLLALLGLHGVRTAVALLLGGCGSTGELVEGLRRESGIDALVRHIDEVFVAGADRLRTSSGIAALRGEEWATAESDDQDTLAALSSRLDRLQLEPALRQVELASAVVDIAAGRLTLAEPSLSRLIALATGPDAARRLGLPDDAGAPAIRDAADEQITAWRRLEGRPPRLLARHARTARELCEQMYFSAC